MKRVMRIAAIVVLVLVSMSRMWWNSIRTVTAGPMGATQSGSSTTQYSYDKNGRLSMVYAPTDEAVIYSYDPAGNFASIRRLTEIELLSFSPQSGLVGTVVTFTGIGFASGVSSVSFNGTPGTQIQVNPPNVTAKVAVGTTTGLVTITTARGVLVTPVPFTVFVGS